MNSMSKKSTYEVKVRGSKMLIIALPESIGDENEEETEITVIGIERTWNEVKETERLHDRPTNRAVNEATNQAAP